jgi:DNA mismatch repair protein MutL
MSFIKVLDDVTINKIAAGEVIERPASIIKELVENSIDSGATEISIDVYGGGISSIRIVDNGRGITEDDLETAFLRHATSKISEEIDLNTISTLGFRGEALASIAAISKVEMISRTKDNIIGNKILIEGGRILSKQQSGAPVGTIISVKEVFYNTPARLKFLKSESREGMYITDIVENLALSNTSISFKYRLNDKTILSTRGDGDLKSVLLGVYGKEVIKNIILINSIKDFVSVKGYIGNSNIAKNSRNNQSIYVNNRFVKNKTITAAVENAFKSMLTINKFPFFVIDVSVNPEFIDVNVHPTKAEVKFQDEQIVFKAVYHSVKNALIPLSDLTDCKIVNEDKPSFASNIPTLNYTQER